jgi:lactate racemase
MMIELKYGRKVVLFEPPPNWTVTTIEPGHPAPCEVERALLSSLVRPFSSQSLDGWLEGKEKILIIVSDITRYTGAEHILPLLKSKFLAEKKVEILFALGNHRKLTDDERKSIVSEEVFLSWPCVDHDCFDDRELSFLGTTESGMEVRVNRRLLDADGIIVTGTISFHYLAGFGGGRKCIIPGVAGYQTILDAHRRVFRTDAPGKDARARTGVLTGNPMHEAIMEGISLVNKPLFLINTILDDEKRFLKVFSGDMEASHEAGCAWYSDYFSATAREKADVVIVSVGGYPKDIDFIQTHKALEHAKYATKPGGTIILLGKCEDGIGNQHFLPWFDYPSIEAMEPDVRVSDKVYSQTAYSTRMKAEQYRVIIVSDLDDVDVRKMGMTPARSLDEAVDLVEWDEHALCYVIPEGSKTLAQE